MEFANCINHQVICHAPTLILIESGWDSSCLYSTYFRYFRCFRNKLRKNDFSFHKSALSKLYSLNDFLLVRSPNRGNRLSNTEKRSANRQNPIVRSANCWVNQKNKINFLNYAYLLDSWYVRIITERGKRYVF